MKRGNHNFFAANLAAFSGVWIDEKPLGRKSCFNPFKWVSGLKSLTTATKIFLLSAKSDDIEPWQL
jgi:hypothetical protein